MFDLIVKKFLAGWLKSKLDKTGSDWKKFAGVILWVLGYVTNHYPTLSWMPVIQQLMDLISSLGVNPVQDAGVVLLATGVLHDFTDWLAAKFGVRPA